MEIRATVARAGSSVTSGITGGTGVIGSAASDVSGALASTSSEVPVGAPGAEAAGVWSRCAGGAWSDPSRLRASWLNPLAVVLPRPPSPPDVQQVGNSPGSVGDRLRAFVYGMDHLFANRWHVPRWVRRRRWFRLVEIITHGPGVYGMGKRVRGGKAREPRSFRALAAHGASDASAPARKAPAPRPHHRSGAQRSRPATHAVRDA